MKTKFKDMKCLFLTGATDDPSQDARLDIVPTMKYITHEGRRFFRLDSSFRILEDGSRAALYLWEDWTPKAMREPSAVGVDAE